MVRMFLHFYHLPFLWFFLCSTLPSSSFISPSLLNLLPCISLAPHVSWLEMARGPGSGNWDLHVHKDMGLIDSLFQSTWMLATCGNITLSPLAAGDGTFVSVACLIATSLPHSKGTNLFVKKWQQPWGGWRLAWSTLLQTVRSMPIHSEGRSWVNAVSEASLLPRVPRASSWGTS